MKKFYPRHMGNRIGNFAPYHVELITGYRPQGPEDAYKHEKNQIHPRGPVFTRSVLYHAGKWM